MKEKVSQRALPVGDLDPRPGTAAPQSSFGATDIVTETEPTCKRCRSESWLQMNEPLFGLAIAESEANNSTWSKIKHFCMNRLFYDPYAGKQESCAIFVVRSRSQQ